MHTNSQDGQLILCLNSGSSTLKFSLYQITDDEETLIFKGIADRIGLDGGQLTISNKEAKIIKNNGINFPDHKTAVQETFTSLEQLDIKTPDAVGHRIVHGGLDYSAPARVTPKLLNTLKDLVSFAPLHLPDEIKGIEAVSARFPGLLQVACFDTAFHRRMPEIAQRFPLPRDLWDEGLRRYGFHGLSYEYILDVLGTEAQDRIIIAHLGNGASMAAVRNGQPLDTTMGFTPAGGFMMGTRTGDLDPGILLYLMNEKGFDSSQIDSLVNNQSGLLGVSGISPDMQSLLEKRESNSDADQAIEMFCYQLCKHIGSLTAVLGGLDTIVFTGGIGENAASVRWDICKGLEYLGIKLDEKKNKVNSDIISASESSCVVRVIPTNEALMIARHTFKLIS